MPYTEAQKRATYKWRELNKEYVNQTRIKFNRNYVEKNLEKYRISSNKYYYLQKELKLFRNILIDA